jgi:hypothetical protein
MLDAELPQKNYTLSYNGMYVRKIYHSEYLLGKYRFN